MPSPPAPRDAGGQVALSQSSRPYQCRCKTPTPPLEGPLKGYTSDANDIRTVPPGQQHPWGRRALACPPHPLPSPESAGSTNGRTYYTFLPPEVTECSVPDAFVHHQWGRPGW